MNQQKNIISVAYKYMPTPRYLLSGGSAFLVEYGSFYVLYQIFSVELYLANSLSFCLGLIISFLLNRGWAFKKDQFKYKRHHQMLMYLALACFNLLLTNIVIGLLKHGGIEPKIGKIIVQILIAFWDFLAFNFIVFSEKDSAA